MRWILLIYIPMSLLSSLLLILDKAGAKLNRRRISERTLHTVELLGGWPGSWLTQRLIRHKISKRPYQHIFNRIVITHAAVLILVLSIAQ